MVKPEWVRYYRDLLAAGYRKGEAASMVGYEYDLSSYQIRFLIKLANRKDLSNDKRSIR
jgi:hypothetical protein